MLQCAFHSDLFSGKKARLPHYRTCLQSLRFFATLNLTPLALTSIPSRMQTYTDHIVMSCVMVVINLDVLCWQRLRTNAHMSVTVGRWPERCANVRKQVFTVENERSTQGRCVYWKNLPERPRQVNGNTKVRGTRQLPLRFRCQEPGTRRAPWCASLEFVWLLNRQSAGKNATLKPHRHRLQFASMLLASSHYTFATGRSANIIRHTHCFALLLCRCVAVLLVCISF